MRQLAAELHIENDPAICNTLLKFLSKFHLVSSESQAESVQS